jgi:hypothetical protein
MGACVREPSESARCRPGRVGVSSAGAGGVATAAAAAAEGVSRPPVSLSMARARAAVELEREILRSSPSDGSGLGVFRPTPAFIYGECPRWAGDS